MHSSRNYKTNQERNNFTFVKHIYSVRLITTQYSSVRYTLCTYTNALTRAHVRTYTRTRTRTHKCTHSLTHAVTRGSDAKPASRAWHFMYNTNHWPLTLYVYLGLGSIFSIQLNLPFIDLVLKNIYTDVDDCFLRNITLSLLSGVQPYAKSNDTCVFI